MIRLLASFAVGSLFGVGLLVSQMTNPAKVLAFLDVTGDWDPSLAFVMGGALVVTFIGYRFVSTRSGPIMSAKFRLPQRTDINARLVGGAALFGIGWGLAGLCPGPALASVLFGGLSVVLFTVAMVGTMFVARRCM